MSVNFYMEVWKSQQLIKNSLKWTSTVKLRRDKGGSQLS